LKRTFVAPTLEAAQRQAEDWWLKQRGFRKLREIKRSPRDSAPTLTKPEQYLVSIVYGRDNQATGMPSAAGPDWSSKLTPSLILKGGDKLATLGDARRVVLAHLTTEVEDFDLTHAMRLLLTAAQTGCSADRKAATDQVAMVLRWLAVY
jgi:hypothetical protein